MVTVDGDACREVIGDLGAREESLEVLERPYVTLAALDVQTLERGRVIVHERPHSPPAGEQSAYQVGSDVP